jgi:hypothetical protein
VHWHSLNSRRSKTFVLHLKKYNKINIYHIFYEKDLQIAYKTLPMLNFLTIFGLLVPKTKALLLVGFN